MPQSSSKLGRKAEKRTAKRLKGRTTPNSGATWHSKADFETEKFLVDNKRTESASYGLSYKDWLTITRHAYLRNKFPAMAIQVQKPKNMVSKEFHIPAEMRLIVIDEETFKYLLEQHGGTGMAQDEKE